MKGSIVFLGKRIASWGMMVCCICSGDARELPLPQVPAELRTPVGRADYLLGHFWDGMDFGDAAAVVDTAFMEGSFANFASVMPHASVAGRTVAVERLMEAAKMSPVAPAMLMEVAERYLYEPQSPVYCEACFEPFARYAVANSLDAERARLLLDDMAQHAPGSPAPDLRLLLADGTETTLLRLVASFDVGADPSAAIVSHAADAPVLLLFYDPDCDGCSRLVSALDGDEVFRRMVGQGNLRVVAINLSEAGASMPHDGVTLPSRWLSVTPRDAGDVHDAYALRTIPALCLLGSDARIILHNATLPLLTAFLRR